MCGLSWPGHNGTTYLVELEGQATRGVLEAVAHLYLRYALMNRCCRILVRARSISALYALGPASTRNGTPGLRCCRIWVHEAPAGDPIRR